MCPVSTTCTQHPLPAAASGDSRSKRSWTRRCVDACPWRLIWIHPGTCSIDDVSKCSHTANRSQHDRAAHTRMKAHSFPNRKNESSPVNRSSTPAPNSHAHRHEKTTDTRGQQPPAVDRSRRRPLFGMKWPFYSAQKTLQKQQNGAIGRLLTLRPALLFMRMNHADLSLIARGQCKHLNYLPDAGSFQGQVGMQSVQATFSLQQT